MTAPTVARHDLPPAWDGQPVTWSDWQLEPWSSHYFHDFAALACRKCGTLSRALHATGTRRPPAGRPWRSLFVTRCLHCGHDTVYDSQDDQAYDLEPDDYGDDGSWPPGEQPPAQGALPGL